MNPTFATLIVIAVIVTAILFFVGWRWASRVWSLPCPSLVGWALESSFYGRITGIEATLKRIGLKPGQRVLEIGPGPGRLLLPAAQQVLPGGEVVGINIQPGMIERLKERATAAKLTNLTAILGDATQPLVTEASFDVVFLVTTLGEIPDRAAALAQAFRALKSGGILSASEMLPDPHYQSKTTVKLLAEAGVSPSFGRKRGVALHCQFRQAVTVDKAGDDCRWVAYCSSPCLVSSPLMLVDLNRTN